MISKKQYICLSIILLLSTFFIDVSLGRVADNRKEENDLNDFMLESESVMDERTPHMLIKATASKIVEANIPISNNRIMMKSPNDFCHFVKDNNITKIYHGTFDVVPYVFLTCEGYYYEIDETWYVYQILPEWLRPTRTNDP